MAERLKTRARINFKSANMKQGYRPDFTIEVEWLGDDIDGSNDEEALYRLGQLINHTEKLAFSKVNEMNLREGFPLVPLDSVVREQESTNGGTRITERIDDDSGEIFP